MFHKILKKNKGATGLKRSFTLVEILVVLAILSILSLTLYVVFDQSLKSWKKAESKLDIYQNARISFEQMTRELEGAVLYYDPANNNFSLIGLNANPDNISFVTPIYTNNGSEYELCKARYYVNNNNLLRELFRNVAGAGASATLALNVTDLQLKYWDSGASNWIDTWHSENGGAQQGLLPKVVKVTITVYENPAMAGSEYKTFETNVYLANSQGQ